ncbi:MAG TPA: hypothetical protein VLF66_03020 [Thermoanaerobaculia bacterium]|nr:hypothetical protein [Thermoanaerobaculia bacterium]
MTTRAASQPLALVALALLAAPLAGEPHPNHAEGFQAERLYQLGELDSVALFNGGLTVQLPLGGSYPVGAGFSYGLTLTYTGNVWDYETVQGPSGFDYIMAFPRRSSNAGLGWKLTLGEDSEEGGYRTPDGSIHPFSEKLHATSPTQAGIRFSTDGSYLRERAGEVELPDGTRHLLLANGKPDLILDRFGNSLDIDYVPAGIAGFPAIRHWKLTDSHGRVHWVRFKAPPALGGVYTEGVVDRVELAAFNGGTATYVFHYSGATTITRGFTDPDVGCNVGSTTVEVPLLERITQPDGSEYQFTYDLGPTTSPAPRVGPTSSTPRASRAI